MFMLLTWHDDTFSENISGVLVMKHSLFFTYEAFCFVVFVVVFFFFAKRGFIRIVVQTLELLHIYQCTICILYHMNEPGL